MGRQPAKPKSPAKSAGAAPKRTPTSRKAAAAKTPRGARGPQTAPAPVTPLAPAESRTRFTLYNFLGKERAYYLVDRVTLEQAPASAKQAVAHSIIIVDRSGSMYSHIEDLKDTLLKLLTIEEYARFELLVTLISYTSQGDLTVHFQRVPIRDVMARNSRYQQEIKKIRATFLTGMSQALQLAASLVKDGELTGITLHSDGFANDPSPATESKNLEKYCEQLQGRDVFINTIAYGDWADFKLLSRVANSVSGSCVKAGSVKEVYDAINSTSQLLGGSTAPPREEPLGPDHDYQVFVSHRAGRVNGAAGLLHIRGLRADDDATVYKYRKLSKDEYDKLKDVPVAQTSEAVFAFAKANLAEGNLNTAKYALASTYDSTLFDRHARALTNAQVSDLAGDLDLVLFQPGVLKEHEVLDHVKVNTRIPLLMLVRLLADHKDGFTVNLSALQKVYRRRGLKRVQGTRDESGKLVEPWLKTEFTDKNDYVPVSSFDINRNTATLNMLISRPVKLVPREGGKPITEVAGVKLDKLSTFNNYTVVSDGELNVPSLQVKVSEPKLFELLKKEGVLYQNDTLAQKHDPKAEYTLKLDDLPLVPPFEGSVKLDGIFRDLAEVKVLTSLLAAHLKEEGVEFTLEQLEELKKHYLSKSLFINFPTTTEYTDLQQALGEGSVDVRVSYKVDLGDREILNLSKLHSANKFLDRMYELTDAAGQKVDKPTCEMLLDPKVKVKHKQLSARTKVTKVDEFMKRIFDDFLGLQVNGSVAAILNRAGEDKLAALLTARRKGQTVNKDEYVKALASAKAKLEKYADNLFNEKVSPLVFYIGATGLLPDEVDAKAQSADELEAKYPDLGFSKDEKEGTFFEIGQPILSVYAKNEYFTVKQ